LAAFPAAKDLERRLRFEPLFAAATHRWAERHRRALVPAHRNNVLKRVNDDHYLILQLLEATKDCGERPKY
jgi:hypothetical protein